MEIMTSLRISYVFTGLRYGTADLVRRQVRVCNGPPWPRTDVTYLFTRSRESHDPHRKIPRYSLIVDPRGVDLRFVLAVLGDRRDSVEATYSVRIGGGSNVHLRSAEPCADVGL